MNKLLVNADDFGMHPLINKGVVSLAERGIINSVSVMTNAEFPDYAALRTLQHNGVFIGVHVSWVRSKWLTGHPDIFGWREFGFKLISGGKKFLDELKEEAASQIEKLLEHDIIPDHLDSHQHVHHFSTAWNIVDELKARYQIKRIRCCKAAGKSLKPKGIGGWYLQRLAALHYHPQQHFCIAGLKYPGNYSFARIAEELTASRGCDTEFIAHPAMETEVLHQLYPDWGFNWKNEFLALQDPRLPELIASCNFILLRRNAESN